jgi:hypothetical protein
MTILPLPVCFINEYRYRYQHVFISFAFCFPRPGGCGISEEVQRIVHSNLLTPKTQSFVFSRFNFAIQTEVAAQLVACLPFTLS